MPRTDTDDGRRFDRRHALLAVLVAGLALVWWPGCRKYPEVTSPRSLTLMRALYTACSSRSPERLAKVERGVEDAAGGGAMTDSERAAFRSIIEQARGGDWEGAERAAFRFAQDQVR
jgi:hypothetical protein